MAGEMKKFFICAKNENKKEELKEDMLDVGFVYDEDDFDFIVSFGGDGTYLYAERKWPGVPKLLVRDSMVCFKCHDEPVSFVLDKLSRGEYEVVEEMKVEARMDSDSMKAVNDVVVRNADVTRGLRFRVKAGDRESDLLIGDGVVVATPFGATGYYYSVCRETFEEGIGVAFNNTTEEVEPWVVGEDESIEVEVVRGVAEVAADNNPDVRTVEEGRKIEISKCRESAKIVTHEH